MPLNIPRSGQFTITDFLGAVAERLSRRKPEYGTLCTGNHEHIDYCTREQAQAWMRSQGEQARDVVWIPDDPKAATVLPEDVLDTA